MKQFKHKKTGVIYTVQTQSIIDVFLKDANYEEINTKKAKKQEQKGLEQDVQK